MPDGYNVNLADNRLNSGDFTSVGIGTFTTDRVIGAGSVSVTYQSGLLGLGRTTEQRSGTFMLGTNGNVYFVPNTPLPNDLTDITVQNAPTPEFRLYKGTAGNDAAINGSTGNDLIYGGPTTSQSGTGSDTINAGLGNDEVYAGDGNDTIYGGGGNDTISGDRGNDELYAGDGNDTAFGGSGNDTIFGGAGDDRINGNGGNDVLYGEAGNDSILGGMGSDTIFGGLDNDRIDGGAGADVIDAGEGANIVLGGTGNDSIVSGSGADTLSGNAGSDSINAGGGSDTVFGGDSADTIDAGTGNDTVYGEAGDDSILGGDGNDTLYGDDPAIGTAASENLSWTTQAASGGNVRQGFTQDTGQINVSVSFRDDGTLTETTTSNTPIFTGTSGISTTSSVLLRGAAGQAGTATIDFAADPASGVSDSVRDVGFWVTDIDGVSDGTNNFFDEITVTAFNADGVEVPVTITLPVGSNDTVNGQTVTAGLDSDEANQPDGAAYFQIAGPVTSIEIAFNNANGGTTNHAVYLSDVTFTTTVPTAGNDTIDGGAGDDILYGGGGNDTLIGRTGSDRLYGGDGDDFLDDEPGADNGTSVDSFYGGAGTDTMYLGGGNDLAFGGTGNDFIFGEEGNDSLSGDAGNDEISGGQGTDTLFGGDGDDRLFGGDDADSLSGGIGNDTLSGDAGNDILEGGAGNDALDGGTGNDVLRGGTGDDILVGAAGNDTLYGETGNDTVFGGAGDDTVVLTDGWGVDTVDGGVEDLADRLDATAVTTDTTLTLTDPETGTLSDGTNTATFAEIEAFFLGSGNDTVIGSAGADTVHMGAGDDTFRLADGFGADTVTGGEGAETAGDTLDARAVTQDLTLNLAAGLPDDGEDGTLSDGASTLTFAQIERVLLGSGDDTVIGSTGNDTVDMGDGDDTFRLADAFGTDTIAGGDGGQTTGDTLDASALTQNLTLDLSAGDPASGQSGTLTTGTDTVTFTQIETIRLGGGDDSVIGSTGDDTILAGDGADTIDAGAGNDVIDLGGAGGTPDGTADTIVLRDVAGDDRVENFDAPIDNGDGTFTGIDRLDVSDLTDADGNPVNIHDVVVAGDGAGGSILFFPGGVSLALPGVSALLLDNPQALAAIGIPLSDGTISGTAGDDLIDTAYTGDPDKDRVDADDAVLIGDAADDDLIEAGDGNDTVLAGDGDDVVFGGTGNDDLTGGAGNDALHGDSGNDTLRGGAGDDTLRGGDGDDTVVLADDFGNDTVVGGEGNETSGDRLDATGVTQGLTLDLSAGDPASGESGTVSNGTDTVSFSDVEFVVLGAGDDSVIGSTGADTIQTGAGADIIDAGAGDDTIELGGPDGQPDGDRDTVLLRDGSGNDRVLNFDAPVANGDGTYTPGDTFDVSALTDAEGNPVNTNDVTVTDDGLGGSILSFPNGERVILDGIPASLLSTPQALAAIGIPLSDGTVSGTAGDDVIDTGYTGDPDGDRVDSSDAIGPGDAPDDDLIEAGAGNDRVLAGAGDDVVFGGSGDDTLDGGAGNDTLSGEDGADTLLGQAGDDTLLGGAGDDVLDGGAGSDSLDGGAGNDTLVVGDGDSATGGAGDDVFTLADGSGGASIVVTGGAGDEVDGDTLRLGTRGNLREVRESAVDDGTGSFSGTATLDDGSVVTFDEIENIICFTPGALIATPMGARDVASLRKGDLVVTRDHGLQPIRWIRQRTVPAQGRFAPVRIRPGVMTGQDGDLLVSPQHRMLFQGYRAELLFGESEVLVPARHLIDGTLVTQEDGGSVTYVHMMFDSHEIVYANGAPTESFHPGSVGLTAVCEDARDELFAIFPELRSDVSVYGYTARRCLKKHEARLLIP